MWEVFIEYRKDGTYVELKDLQSIEYSLPFDEITSVSNFANFRKSDSIEYSFIAKNKSVAINGSDIIQLTFTKVG